MSQRICIACGRTFDGKTSAKRCPDCRATYQRDWRRKKTGWTDVEIANNKREGKREVIPGQRFGRLIVMRKERYDDKNHSTIWQCICDCGNKTKVRQGNLLSGGTTSCGCAFREVQQSPEKRITALKASPNTGRSDQNMKAKAYRLSDGKHEYIVRNLNNFCRENSELFDIPAGDIQAAEQEAKALSCSSGKYRRRGCWTVEHVYDCVCYRCGKRFASEFPADLCPACDASQFSRSAKPLPPLLRRDGPFELVTQPDPRHYIAKCKRCGKVIKRGASYFYSKSVISCGCANAERLGIHNKIDERYVYQDSNGKFRVVIQRYHIRKSFASLDEAVRFRDDILSHGADG